MQLDPIDHHMLRILQEDGRISNAALAGKVGLSPSACLRRLHLLEQRGVILGYTALVATDEPELTPTTVMVEIVLDRQTAEQMSRFEQAVRRCPEVRECWLMSGASDYLLRVEARDAPDYERIHQQLARMPGVSRITSSFTIRAVTRPGPQPRPTANAPATGARPR
jgi:DNA-binding Lrp family transcriptional regulator